MRDILQIDEPTLVIPTIEISDIDSNENRKDEYEAGAVSPLIRLAGNFYSRDNIEEFKIRYGDTLLPSIRIKIKDKGSNILLDEYDFIDTFDVYLKSRNLDFKPISVSFLVESKRRDKDSFIFEGNLFIEGVDNQRIKGYKGTSYDVVRQVASEHGLGFASNVTSSEDEQNWLCVSQSTIDFLEEIENRSWINEISSVKIWIDLHYNINYFDMGEANTQDPEDLPISTEVNNSVEFSQDKSEKLSELFLTNDKSKNGTPSFIKKHVPIDRSGSLEREIGNEVNFKTQDIDTKEYFEYVVEQTLKMETKNRSGKISRSTYLGFSSNNTHRNYDHSPIQNSVLSSIYKSKGLNISLSPINTSIYNGIIIPIFLMNEDNINRDKKGDTPISQYNLSLSGNYIVDSIKIHYERGVFAMELFCVKIREDIKN